MTISIISSDTVGAGTQFTFSAIGDELFVMSGTLLGSTSGSAVDTQSLDSVRISVYGSIISAAAIGLYGSYQTMYVAQGGDVAISLSDSSSIGINVAGAGAGLVNDGTISTLAAVAVVAHTENLVINNGTIVGATPVFLGLFGVFGSNLVNSGTISATSYDDVAQGVRFNNGVIAEGTGNLITNLATGSIVAVATEGAGVRFNQAAGGSVLRNFGTVQSTQDFGVNLNTVTASQALITVRNSGTIVGGDGAYRGSVNADLLVNFGSLIGNVLMGDQADTLRNRGTIDGEVDLGLGDDFYDGRKGEVTEKVLGGAGGDRFIGNANENDSFDGGAGSDILDFRSQGAAIVALDEAFGNAGAALGDSYAQFEVIYGSLSDGDRLRGNSSANSLLGFGGDDRLIGVDGSDTLRGGTGTDTLVGGNGNDTFQYTSLDDIGDVITDFSSAASGNNDRFVVTASAFGGGLAAGTLAATRFQSRADNLAQDADDRFVFRTTDKTLWFDVDGNGAAAAVMVADLQATATMTNADIVLI